MQRRTNTANGYVPKERGRYSEREESAVSHGVSGKQGEQKSLMKQTQRRKEKRWETGEVMSKARKNDMKESMSAKSEHRRQEQEKGPNAGKEDKRSKGCERKRNKGGK